MPVARSPCYLPVIRCCITVRVDSCASQSTGISSIIWYVLAVIIGHSSIEYSFGLARLEILSGFTISVAFSSLSVMIIVHCMSCVVRCFTSAFEGFFQQTNHIHSAGALFWMGFMSLIVSAIACLVFRNHEYALLRSETHIMDFAERKMKILHDIMMFTSSILVMIVPYIINAYVVYSCRKSDI